jgi:hypothetical protein
LASPDPTGATVVAAAIPNGSVGPSLDQTAADETSELLDNPLPTRSRRKILIAVAAILVVGLVASAIAFRSQGSDQAAGSDVEEELVVATTVPTTLVVAEPPTTVPPTPTTRIAPAPTAPAATVDPAIQLAACTSALNSYISERISRVFIGNATADAPQQTSTNPLTWLVVFRYTSNSEPTRDDATVVCQPNGRIIPVLVTGLPG